MRRLAVFISPHGLGHAARACALMQALRDACGERVEFNVFTTTPEWFLAESLDFEYRRIEELVDVGLVQRGPLHEDMEATAAAVESLLDPAAGRCAKLAALLRELGVDAVIADIAPLGLMAARQADIPSVLVENFTWDWIYSHHPAAPRSLLDHVDGIRAANAGATLHLQTVPVCQPEASASRVGPIARRPRLGRQRTRELLGVRAEERLALVSLGGIRADMRMPSRLPDGWRAVFLGRVAGEPPPGAQVLPHHSGHYHPDLACAADVIVGKLGYSTVAEAWQAGCGLLWAQRPAFAETEVLAAHARRVLRHAEIEAGSLISGAWPEALQSLQDASAPAPFGDGAGEAALLILRMLDAPTR